ncbi:MAG TPA: hypothetical protein VFK38_05030 [Candidatus Limnocylindrales bacterium]|nr:hypothetical protein [Candidatus Limnocylindrales bacterium]
MATRDPLRRIAELEAAHREATARRDQTELGSEAFIDAAEEVARIEVALNGLREQVAAPRAAQPDWMPRG